MQATSCYLFTCRIKKLNKQLFFSKAVGGIFLYGASNNLKSHLQTQLICTQTHASYSVLWLIFQKN